MGYDFSSALTEAQRMYLNQMFAVRPELQDRMSIDFTPAFCEELKLAADEEYNVDLRFLGDKGNGKSSAALTAKFWFDLYAGNVWDMSTVCFTIQDAIGYLKEHPEAEKVAILIDEQIDQVGDASVTRKKRFSRLQQTTRKHSISFFYCSPRSVFYKDKLFQRYNVWSMRLFDVKQKVQMSFCTDSTNTYGLGSIYLPMIPQEIWKVYNKKKDDFIVKAKMQDITTIDYTKDALKIINTTDIHEVYAGEKEYLTAKREWEAAGRDERLSMTKVYPPENRFDNKYMDITIRKTCGDLISSEREMVADLVTRHLQGEKLEDRQKTEDWDVKIDISKYRKAFMEQTAINKVA